jgi:hypothetical protein
LFLPSKNNAKLDLDLSKEIKDVIEMSINFQDISIDYVPLLSNKHYEKVFKLDPSKKQSDLMFKTPIRCLVLLRDSRLITRDYNSRW